MADAGVVPASALLASPASNAVMVQRETIFM
jgi:hypothetical protein